jgi:hypothetical protein
MQSEPAEPALWRNAVARARICPERARTLVALHAICARKSAALAASQRRIAALLGRLAVGGDGQQLDLGLAALQAGLAKLRMLDTTARLGGRGRGRGLRALWGPSGRCCADAPPLGRSA